MPRQSHFVENFRLNGPRRTEGSCNKDPGNRDILQLFPMSYKSVEPTFRDLIPMYLQKRGPQNCMIICDS